MGKQCSKAVCDRRMRGAQTHFERVFSSTDIEWQKTYGGWNDDGGGGEYEEFVVRVLQDADGNYVVASETSSFLFWARETDIWVIELDPNGNILWQKAYGGPYEDTMWTFVEASDGGYIIPGGTVSFSPDYSGDVWVLKLDKDGDILLGTLLNQEDLFTARWSSFACGDTRT